MCSRCSAKAYTQQLCLIFVGQDKTKMEQVVVNEENVAELQAEVDGPGACDIFCILRRVLFIMQETHALNSRSRHTV